jgi:hypothetical protein
MIKKLINKIFSQKISEDNIECAIDEDTVDCNHLDDDQDKAYVGVPAPILNPIDEWFASPYGCPSAITEKQKEYEHINDDFQDGWWLLPEYQDTKESPNIHQEMYDLATKSGKTTTQLDPIGGSENFQGGSENVHR